MSNIGKAIGGRGNSYQAIRPGGTQEVAFTGTSAQSSAFGAKTGLIRVFATKDCWLNFGANPTATASAGTSVFLPATTIEWFYVTPGEKVAVIQDSDGGDLHIVEAAQ